MRILIVCEGEHEQPRAQSNPSGALRNLIQRLGDNQVEYEAARVSNNKIHAWHGKGGGTFKRACRWLLETKKRGFDALIYLIDQDGHSERIQQIQQAQNYPKEIFPRAMGVAIKTFDAWMLADEQTLTKVLGYTVQTQPDPELP